MCSYNRWAHLPQESDQRSLHGLQVVYVPLPWLRCQYVGISHLRHQHLTKRSPNGGISNFSTLVIQGLGFDTLQTALLGIPQGVLVVIWIVAGAVTNHYLPNNYRTLVCALFMLPTIAGSLGFLLAPTDAYVGRLICFYLTGSYQASFVLSLSLITSNTGGQTKKLIVSALIWFGVCIDESRPTVEWLC